MGATECGVTRMAQAFRPGGPEEFGPGREPWDRAAPTPIDLPPPAGEGPGVRGAGRAQRLQRRSAVPDFFDLVSERCDGARLFELH